MVGLFKQKAPGNVAVLFIFALLLKLPMFLQPSFTTSVYDGPFYVSFLSSLLSPQQSLYAAIIGFVLLYLQAMMVNYLVNEYRMTAKQTFLPAMSFILVTSLVPEWNKLSAPLVCSVFVLWAFIRMLRLYNLPKAGGKIYNIGLLIALASFFYVPALLFSGVLLMGILILRPFRLNEIFLFLVGALTPFYFYASYLFLADKLQWQNILPIMHQPFIKSHPSYWMFGAFVLLGIPFLMGGFYIQAHLRKMLIQARKNWSILLLFIIVGGFIPFFNTRNDYTNWILIAAPIAAFHSCAYLYPPRRWVSLVLFFIMLVFVLSVEYAPHSFGNR